MDAPHSLKPPVLEQLPPFFTIGRAEGANLVQAMRKPLSGYLGGIPRGGYWVERLSSRWCETFNVKHAVPCNSATSGLLAACMAAGIGPRDNVWITAMSMSATAACAKVLGANIAFIDIESNRFSMDMRHFGPIPPKAIIVTNLFGHPAYLKNMRSWCNSNKVIMIEDNAQSPFAREGDKYAGTIGHIGVFSLNVHKHIQAGEGGVIVTDDQTLGNKIRAAINHGELGKTGQTGLNLRITEPIAAIADAQLSKASLIIQGRIELAEEVTEMFKGIPWIVTPKAHDDCTHVYYHWVGRVLENNRDDLLTALWAYNFPIRKGYSPTLNRVFKSNHYCSVAERMEDEELIIFENCCYDPTTNQRNKMREIVKYAADYIQ